MLSITEIKNEGEERFSDFLDRSEFSGLLINEQPITVEMIKNMVLDGEIIFASEVTDNKYMIHTRKNGLQNLEIL